MTDPKIGEDRLEANVGNRGKGRPPGAANKSTTEVKKALQEAFERRGGVDALLTFADENPRDFYAMWVKLLPTEVKAQFTGEMTFREALRQRHVLDAEKSK